MFQLEHFANPGPEYGIHPFWFWNGAMEDGEIERQIREMAEKEVGGFFICPRQGLQIPYLSDEWFRKVRLAVEAAQRYGLQVWLYDEYPYPSGIAGGEVTLAHPEAKHYTLKHMQQRLVEGESCLMELPWARVLYAKAVPLDPATGEPDWEEAVDIRSSIGNFQAEPVFQKAGLTAYNRKRFFTYKTVKKLHWRVPAGQWEVHCSLEEEIRDFKYYGTFVDPCNEEAMRTFIALTHDRYAQELGDYFGSVIQGMFTDEIGLLGKLPWSPRIPEAFLARNGYDLRDHLHALIVPGGESAAKVRYDYYQTIHELLRSSYHKQVHDWCERHGLRYVAEVPSVRMTTQLYSHVPGGDSGHEKLGRSLEWIIDRYAPSLRYNPRMVSSLANQLARERVLIECFHSVGWSMTLQDAKWMIDRLAAMGINFYNFHAFFYTLDAMTKHDAPPSQFLQNPYWTHFGALGAYVRRISYAMSSGTPDRTIAVLDPTTSFWTHMGNPFHEFQYGGVDEAEKGELERLKQEWFTVCKTLVLNGRDFEHLDPELLAEADVGGGMLRIGHAAYSAVVLPSMTNLESRAWGTLKRFIAQGGTVIAAGSLPNETIETDSRVVSEMKETLVPVDPEEPIPLLERRVPEPVRLRAGAAAPLLIHRRRLEDGSMLVFVSNQEGGTHQVTLGLDESLSRAAASRLDLETGGSVPIAREAGSVPLQLGPYESVLLQLKEEAGFDEPASAAEPIELDAAGPWSLHAEQHNAVRFDSFELRLAIGDGPITEEGTLVQAKTFIDQCEDIAGDQRLPLQFSQLFGTPMKLQAAYPIRCRYTASFMVEKIPETCHLLKDRGAISGEYVLSVNGVSFGEEHFEDKFVYDHCNQVCDVRSALVQGLNKLTIDITLMHDWDGVTDALYLWGGFGVAFEGEGERRLPVIGERPAHAELRGGAVKGYPYYAGTLVYRRRVKLDRVPDGEEVVLRFKDWDPHFHDCAEVFVDGHSLGVRPWTPYEWRGPASLLRQGDHEIEVRVANSLIGLLEGKVFDYASHSLRDLE